MHLVTCWPLAGTPPCNPIPIPDTIPVPLIPLRLSAFTGKKVIPMRPLTALLACSTILIIAIGCSKSHTPVIPPVDDFSPPRVVDTTGHVVWGAWECAIDRDTLEVSVQPMRSVENHFDVTSFILPPSCHDCMRMTVIDVDLTQSLFSVRVMLRNPIGLTGYDVRGIFYLKGDQQLVSADNWTDLFDLPGDYARNPFQAFAKEAPGRAFGGGETHSATYRVLLPPGQMGIRFTVEASYPSNCPEPYEMKIIKGIGFLGSSSQYSETLEVAVRDWQSDISLVQLDMSSLGATLPLDLVNQAGIWKATVSNIWGAAPGWYTVWLQSRSAAGPWTYQPIDIEVKNLGGDRLPEILSLMHNWDASGNPNETLTKDNFKYEGRDLNYIIDDMGYGSTRLPYYNDIHREPLTTVPYFMNVLDNLEAHTSPPILYNLLSIGTNQLGETFPPTSFAYAPTASPIADAMESLYSEIGSTLSPSDKSAIASQTASLPADLQVMAAAILKAVSEGYQYREDAISGYSGEVKDILFENGTDWCYGSSIYFAVLEEAADFDYPSMYRAAGPVLQAIDGMRDAGLYYIPQDSSSWSWETPIGTVEIGGSGNDTFSDDEYLLILDPGGDDTYNCQAGANASLDNPFSICIDLAGNDTYNDQGNTNYSQGAGRLGVGVLWDVYGNDEYDNYRFCQGFGHWGVGVILDSGGNDQYDADGCSQGSGYMGIGIMVDEWGHDNYDCYQYSQGFGFVKGWGLACDIEGDDRWIANDTNIKYPGPQTDQHNTSMSQGQGFGLRWDYENTYQSGGQGILFDRAGDDEYSCGVFGQACAYWFGTGILADYGGTDTMHGIWYVQAGTAHYGTAVLLAKGVEDDSYTATMGVGVGGGHDFSNSFLLEEGGNDTYSSVAHSLGGGNECGVGFFVDYSGDDTYLTTHTGSMGNGYFSDGRNRGSWGLFFDLGGTDSYQSAKMDQGAGDNTNWTINDIGAAGDFPGGIILW